ncbi:MAG: hypothetical protein JW751_28830 [Polyangiaceae bacterium]|nr:hypothetical protein [Polyangiaceae bacterium]
MFDRDAVEEFFRDRGNAGVASNTELALLLDVTEGTVRAVGRRLEVRRLGSTMAWTKDDALELVDELEAASEGDEEDSDEDDPDEDDPDEDDPDEGDPDEDDPDEDDPDEDDPDEDDPDEDDPDEDDPDEDDPDEDDPDEDEC